MTRKKRKQTAQPRAEQTRPTISLRLSRPMLSIVDTTARRLGVDRTGLISLVLVEYLQERGEEGIAALAAKGVRDDQTIDLFA